MSTSTGTLVTPEGVLLDFEPAGIASRALAKTIDFAAQGVLIAALLIALGLASTALPDWVPVVLAVVGIAAAIFVYPMVFETLWRGRTPGKAALGLRVYTEEGAPVGWLQSFIRSVLQLVDFFIPPGGLCAVLTALFTRKSQRLGDLVAGTVVVRERSTQSPPMPVSFPPPYGWEGYAASLDVSAVHDDQYRLVRSFLLRVNELSPAARASLSVRLAERTRDRMQHVPPPGLHPELFLVCVAAAYQRRHGGASAPPAPTYGAPPGYGPPVGYGAPPPSAPPPSAPPPGGPPPPAPAPAPVWPPPPPGDGPVPPQ